MTVYLVNWLKKQPNAGYDITARPKGPFLKRGLRPLISQCIARNPAAAHAMAMSAAMSDSPATKPDAIGTA